MKKPDLAKVLSFDPLSAAEDISGKSYKEDELTSSLGLAIHLAHVQNKAKILQEAGDSTFTEPLESYLRIIEAEGFRKVYYHVLGDPESPKNEFCIYWHDADAILLVFDTYSDNTCVNGGKFYYNWKPTGNIRSGVTSSGSMTEEGVWVGDHDCREAIRFHIAQLRTTGSFVNPWVKRPFLWLLDYMNARGEYDYDAINAKRIAELPKEVRDAITPKP